MHEPRDSQARAPHRSRTALTGALTVGLAVGVVLLVAGCGTSDPGGAGSAGSPSSGSPSSGPQSSGPPSSATTLPADWPEEVGVPAGFTVVSAPAVAGSGKPSYAATLTAPGDRSADVTTWLNGLESAGFTRNDEFGAANQASTAVVLENDRWTVSTITSVLDGRTQLAVNVDPR